MRWTSRPSPAWITSPARSFRAEDTARVRVVTQGDTRGLTLRLTLSDRHITYDAVAFNQGAWAEAMPPAIDILYSYETNEYNGRTSLQLNVRDLKPAGQLD